MTCFDTLRGQVGKCRVRKQEGWLGPICDFLIIEADLVLWCPSEVGN